MSPLPFFLFILFILSLLVASSVIRIEIAVGILFGHAISEKTKSGTKLPKGARPPYLLRVGDVLDQVRRLALQKLAQGIDVFPRNALPFSQLLESRLAQQLLTSNAIGRDSFLFKCGNHVEFVFQSHNKYSFPMILPLYHKCTRNQVYKINKNIHASSCAISIDNARELVYNKDSSNEHHIKNKGEMNNV